MRILLVTYWSYPHIGGVSTHLNIVRSRLEEMGHEVDVLAQHPNLTKYYFVQSGVSIHKQSYLKTAESAVKLIFKRGGIEPTPWILWRETEKYAFELVCNEIPLEDYDLIHAQDIISSYVCRKAKPPHVPLVTSIHSCLATEWIANNEIQVRSRLERDYLSLEEYFGSMSPDCLIVPSRWLSASLSYFHVNHPSESIIPYGLNQKVYRDLLKESETKASLDEAVQKNIGKRKTVIACPARLVVIKEQTYLLQTIRKLADVAENVVCWLIGDGVTRRELEQQVNNLGLGNHVFLLGNRDDVPQLLSQADIVVFPSLQDNLPYSIIEAQSLGKPVVASRTGGILEMIEEGINGLLAEPRNVQELYEKLLLLIQDEELRAELSREARKRALAVWNDTVMLEQMLHVYEKAVTKGSEPVLWEQDFIAALKYCSKNYKGIKEGGIIHVTSLLGKVLDTASRRPVSNANIHLLDISGVVLRSISSDAVGRFRFHDVQPGNYELGWSVPMSSGLRTRKIVVSTLEPLNIEVTV